MPFSQVNPTAPPVPLEDLQFPLLLAGRSENRRLFGHWPKGVASWTLHLRIRGDSWFGEDTPAHIVRPGDLLLVHPHTPMTYANRNNNTANSLYWVLFHPPIYWLPLLAWPPWHHATTTKLSLRSADLRKEAHALFDQIIDVQNPGDPIAALRSMHLLEEFLLRCRHWAPNVIAPQHDPRIEAVIQHMGRHLDRPLSVAELAKIARLSPSRFAALFHQETDRSPKAYLAAMRIDHARSLLAFTPMLVKQIAAKTGFASLAYFSAQFQKQTGQSPSRYREYHKKKQP